MFVQIGNQRIKISSIGRYRDMGLVNPRNSIELK